MFNESYTYVKFQLENGLPIQNRAISILYREAETAADKASYWSDIATKQVNNSEAIKLYNQYNNQYEDIMVIIEKAEKAKV